MSSMSSPTSTSSSTMSPSPGSTAKDFEHTFGQLSSLYGFHGTPYSTPPAMTMKTPVDPPSHNLNTFCCSSMSTLVSNLGASATCSSTSSPAIVPLGRRNSARSDVTAIDSATGQKTKRDYEAAFGALLSTYGIAGHVPTFPNDRHQPSGAESKLTRLIKGIKRSCLSTINTDAGCLVPTSPDRGKVDYQSAFGKLSSTYGFYGSTPTPPNKRQKASHHNDKKDSKSFWFYRSSSRAPQDENTPDSKDYNAAYGTLTSAYGFNGCAPVVSKRG